MADHAACAPPSLRRALRCWLIVLGACVAGVSPVFHAAAPVQYRFTTDEVYIRRDPQTGDVILSQSPGCWDEIYRVLDEAAFPDDFREGF